MTSPTQQGLVPGYGLNDTTLQELQELARLCNEHEGLDIKLNWSILRQRPTDQLNDFLYYADGQLVGFLALFAFNTHEGEVSGMVHPTYRRRGIFRQLFAAASQEAQKRGLASLLLIVDHASSAGQAFAQNLSTSYDHSEYKMFLEHPDLTAPTQNTLQFRTASAQDTTILSTITAQAFHIPQEEVDWYSAESLSRSDRHYYVGEVDGVIVGKIDVSLSNDAALILGFAVQPDYQGRGYGRQILTQTVQELLKHDPKTIWLEVSTENRNALSLYQSCGFTEKGSDDYYRLQLKHE